MKHYVITLESWKDDEYKEYPVSASDELLAYRYLLFKYFDECAAKWDMDEISKYLWRHHYDFSIEMVGQDETGYYVDIEEEDGFKYHYICDDMNSTLYAAAEILAFDDCTGARITHIQCGNMAVEYAGWRPGMEYDFISSETGEIVWEHSFPQWDH